MEDQLTPEDMSNLFRFFRIPTPLYESWRNYAQIYKLNMQPALAKLLQSVHDYPIPSYDTFGFVDIAQDWSCTQPKIYRQKLIKQFHFKYTQELQKEIFYIFKQTGYANQSIRMNKEICARLAFALKRIGYLT